MNFCNLLPELNPTAEPEIEPGGSDHKARTSGRTGTNSRIQSYTPNFLSVNELIK